MPTCRLHDHIGDDLGLLEHPARNVEPGDVVVLVTKREALVTARIEAGPGLARTNLQARSVLYRPLRERC